MAAEGGSAKDEGGGETRPGGSLVAKARRTQLPIATISACVSVTVAFVTYISHRHDLELQKIKQDHEHLLQYEAQRHKIRMDFLDKIRSFEEVKSDYYRRDVLSFFAKVMDDGALKEGALKAWAQSELDKVNDSISKREEQLRAEAEQARKHEATARAQLDKVEKDVKEGVKSRVVLQRNVTALRENLVRAQQQSRHAQVWAESESARRMQAEQIAVTAVLSSTEVCPSGSKLVSSQGPEATALADCLKAAPKVAHLGSKWTAREGAVFCACMTESLP
jgi:hypothetical protein